ncbi:MAG: PAS domain S-box protein [Gemmatimonadota bacterium]|nr:PAS domain S-box protein [Gemmatimonadota bacterium]
MNDESVRDGKRTRRAGRITPRTAAATLRECEERYRAIFELHPLAMLVWDYETKRFVAANDAAVTQYGYTREELLELTVWDIRPSEEIPRVRAIIERLPRGRHAFAGLRHQKKDGTAFSVDVVAHDVTWDGRPARLLFAADATERVRAEAALRESEARMRLVMRASNDAVYDWDVSSGRVHWSGGGTFGYGDGEQDFDISWWAERVHPDDRARVEATLEAAVAGTAESWTEEYQFLRGDGLYAAVLDRGLIVRGLGGQPVRMIGCMADLTERRRLEDQLRQSQKMEAVGRLAGGVAHDFNNVLTVVKSFSDFLLEDLDKLDPRRSDVEEIAKAADRAAALTRKLLAFSRKQVMRPEPLDLNAVVAGMEKMLERLIGEDVRVVTSLEPGLFPVEADPSSIEQAILNLAVNARDAMPDGGILTIRTKNEMLDKADAAWAIRPGRYAMLSVSDTGHGMDVTTQARVFEPFFTTKPQGQGTGLGLAMVYGIVKQSGGHVWVESKPDEGTTFTVYLPQPSDIDAGAFRAGPRSAGEPHPAHARGGETILLVDDEEAVRSSARRALERAGYDVIAATDGSDALRLFTEHDGGIHMVVTDVVMPGLSGRELVGRLRIMRPKLRVLFVSGYTEEGVRRQGVLEPGAAYLEKPFTPERLLRKVREVLDG